MRFAAKLFLAVLSVMAAAPMIIYMWVALIRWAARDCGQ